VPVFVIPAVVVVPVAESVVKLPAAAVVPPIATPSIVPPVRVSVFATLASGRMPVTFVVRSIVPFAMSAFAMVPSVMFVDVTVPDAMSLPVIDASTIFAELTESVVRSPRTMLFVSASLLYAIAAPAATSAFTRSDDEKRPAAELWTMPAVPNAETVGATVKVAAL
jgi:hypothetical protein